MKKGKIMNRNVILYWFSNLFQISQRYQSSLAYVNAGFLFGVKTEPQGLRFAGKPRIAFGGTNLEVNPEFVSWN